MILFFTSILPIFPGSNSFVNCGMLKSPSAVVFTFANILLIDAYDPKEVNFTLLLFPHQAKIQLKI